MEKDQRWSLPTFQHRGDHPVDAEPSLLETEPVQHPVPHGRVEIAAWSYAVLFHLGGAVADVAEGATAYSHRRATHNLNVHAAWLPEQPGGEDEVAWARRFFAAVAPRSAGTYVNFLDGDDHDRVRSAYGAATYRRLVALRHRHDPDGVFRGPHPTRASTRPESTRPESAACP